MRTLAFHKMHGLGNDFVVIDGREVPAALSTAAVQRVGDRHRGVGFDQLVLIEASATADARMVFLNPDGGEAGACGNGTRCAARLLGDLTGRDELALDTVGGLLRASATADGQWSVTMAEPRFGWSDVPLAEVCDTDALPIVIDGLPRPAAVSMGNPHAVFLIRSLEGVDPVRLGTDVGRRAIFPEGANVGFAQVVDPGRIRLRVYERGAGLTLACGSGACAAMVVARRRGLVGDRVTMVLDGGELEVVWSGAGPVTMTGPAAYSFAGTLGPELLDD